MLGVHHGARRRPPPLLCMLVFGRAFRSRPSQLPCLLVAGRSQTPHHPPGAKQARLGAGPSRAERPKAGKPDATEFAPNSKNPHFHRFRSFLGLPRTNTAGMDDSGHVAMPSMPRPETRPLAPVQSFAVSTAVDSPTPGPLLHSLETRVAQTRALCSQSQQTPWNLQ